MSGRSQEAREEAGEILAEMARLMRACADYLKKVGPWHADPLSLCIDLTHYALGDCREMITDAMAGRVPSSLTDEDLRRLVRLPGRLADYH